MRANHGCPGCLMRLLTLLFTLALLAGCAKPAWVRMPELSMPDFSSWFNSENAIAVEEVAGANVCHSATGESEITLMPGLGALNTWAAGRSIELVSATGKPLPQTQYAIVELGQREHGGYGLAVSRQAGVRSGALLLKATFFEPQPGRWANSEPSSPCVVVSLPPREYSDVKVIDQSGKVRAGTEGKGS